PTRFSGGIADFQVQLLGGPKMNRLRQSDIYVNNLKRLLKGYQDLKGRLDPSEKGARVGLKGLIRLIVRWKDDRRRLEEAGAGEVVQVPRYPRTTAHRHVSTWDEVVLPR